MRSNRFCSGLALLLLALAGCREIPVDELTFGCEGDGDCPPGQSCCRGLCQDPEKACSPVDAGADAAMADRPLLDTSQVDAATLDRLTVDVVATDRGLIDAAAVDSASTDTVGVDAAMVDGAAADVAPGDVGALDTAQADGAGLDVGVADSGASPDGSAADVALLDAAGALDAGHEDAAAVADTAVGDTTAGGDAGGGPDAGGWDVAFTAPAGYCRTAQCYPVPPGGQGACYGLDAAQACTTFPCDDAGLPALCGQDFQYPDLVRTFTCLDDDGTPFACADRPNAAAGELVVDALTGLMWQRTSEATQQTWERAASTCADSTYAAFADWRLPGPHELQSLVDDGVATQLFDHEAFPGTPYMAYHWTGARTVSDPSKAWFVSFGVGSTGFLDASPTALHVRCVRAGIQAATGTYDRWHSDDGQTVHDRATGLVWQADRAASLTWPQALQTCEQLSLAGVDDWRLPSKKELVSLLDYGASSPASHFPGPMDSSLWSSTTYAPDPRLAWTITCANGVVSAGNKTTTFRSRCVRGGP